MRFTTDDEQLSITVELTDEPASVDLAEGGDGDRILDFAVQQLLDGYARERAPDGSRWAELAPATVRAKHHDKVGYRTGSMLDPGTVAGGPRDITPRSATWTFPQPKGRRKREHGFHNGIERTGQPARRLVGWTDAAASFARRIIADASFRADP